MTKQKQFPVRFEIRMSDEDHKKLSFLSDLREEGKAAVLRELIRHAYYEVRDPRNVTAYGP